VLDIKKKRCNFSSEMKAACCKCGHWKSLHEEGHYECAAIGCLCQLFQSPILPVAVCSRCGLKYAKAPAGIRKGEGWNCQRCNNLVTGGRER
jgi:hypothetical protein